MYQYHLRKIILSIQILVSISIVPLISFAQGGDPGVSVVLVYTAEILK